MAIKDGVQFFTTGIDDMLSTIDANPIKTAGVVALGAGAAGVGTGLLLSSITGKKTKKKRSKTRKKIRHTKRGWAQDRKRKSKQKWEIAYQRRKKRKSKRSKRGVHYTKHGQPYKIMPNGRARFIKRKGGKR